MCMITLVPAGVEVPEDGIDNGASTNDDGHGYAIASAAHGMDTFKSMKFETTMDHLLVDRAKHGPGSVVLFHSRWATHGEFGEFNIHPFPVGDQSVMAHNGIMPTTYHPLKDERRSDTRIFADWVAAGYCETASGVPSQRGAKALASIIGGGNKLAFLSVKSGKPAVRIVNAKAGIQVDGVWYSNDGYRYSGYSRRDWAKPDWWGDDYGYGTLTLGQMAARVDERRDQMGCSEVEEGTVCPMCDGEIDLITNLCMVCDFCIDCEEYAEACMCYVPSSERLQSSGTSLWEVEDCADDGWVKVNGVWTSANSLIPEVEKPKVEVEVEVESTAKVSVSA